MVLDIEAVDFNDWNTVDLGRNTGYDDYDALENQADLYETAMEEYKSNTTHGNTWKDEK